jgi:hypothetical protein
MAYAGGDGKLSKPEIILVSLRWCPNSITLKASSACPKFCSFVPCLIFLAPSRLLFFPLPYPAYYQKIIIKKGTLIKRLSDLLYSLPIFNINISFLLNFCSS